ncbi:MAG: zinc-binding dehydrogenase [Gemmatimonadaceae bacterium]|nr:zinc-binding dehydrogenase [Gemmatimonadaceae bacterium]
MRGLVLNGHGGLEQLAVRTDLPDPTPPTGDDVLVRITAAALNHLDLFVLEGIPGVTLQPDWIPLADGTGVVEAVGEAVTGVRPGDTVVINPGLGCRRCDACLAGEQPLCPRFRLLGEHRPGTAAEFCTVPAWNVRVIPADTPPEIAAAFTLATLTAYRMVASRARVAAGEQVLIWGIGGGVALAALQLCKAAGATVWVTSSDPAKLARARALGADHVLDHATEDVPAVIRAATGKRGVDVVIDSVGERTWDRSLRALGRAGRLVTCGGTSGPMVQTDVRKLFWNQWSLLGSTMGNDAEFDAIVAAFRAGRLVPPVDSVHAIEDARAAYARLQSGRQFGKVVVRVAP